MPGLFDAPTGGSAVNLQSGSPAYQDAIVQGAQRSLKPSYNNALKRTRQDFSGRGLLDSGLDAQAEMGLQEDYLGKLGDVATGAATKGADLAEHNRQREEERGWQTQDRDKEIERLNSIANQGRDDANANMWSNLIGGVAGAAGTALAGPLGGALVGGLTGAASRPLKSSYVSAKSGNPYGTGLGNSNPNVNMSGFESLGY